MAEQSQVKMMKRLMWLYLVLLIFEGALRKWVLPSLSNELLIIRDPIVMLIYMLALRTKRMVFNGYIFGCVLLAALTALSTIFIPDTNIIVTLIGLRTYFLHLPLIFVMERTLEAEDIWRMGRFLFWLTVPMTVLLIAQYRAPQTSWVNLTVGGSVSQGFSGANGHFRPSGTFSFTTGVSSFFPLVLAMLGGFVLGKQKLSWILTGVTGTCVFVSLFFSISRTYALTCALILIAGGIAVLILPKQPRILGRLILAGGVISLLIALVYYYNGDALNEGVDTFEDRWVDAGTENFQASIVDRAASGVTPVTDLLFNTDMLGRGVGYGTMMAQGFMNQGHRSFGLGENEWPRIILEMGPILGLSFIILRICLCVHLFRVCFSALQRGNALPALIGVEAILQVLNAQWSQPTTLGFATFAAGLTLAAARMGATASAKPVKRRAPRPRQSSWQHATEPQTITSFPLPGPQSRAHD